MKTPRTDEVCKLLIGAPFNGHPLVDLSRQLETQVQELRAALSQVLTQLEIVLPVTGLVHDERQAIISARAILEKLEKTK